jgi:hypothetical protein
LVTVFRRRRRLSLPRDVKLRAEAAFADAGRLNFFGAAKRSAPRCGKFIIAATYLASCVQKRHLLLPTYL